MQPKGVKKSRHALHNDEDGDGEDGPGPKGEKE